MIREFCEDAAAFLGGANGRTIAVHCKAGRGRTGLMVCAYLLHAVRSLSRRCESHWCCHGEP